MSYHFPEIEKMKENFELHKQGKRPKRYQLILVNPPTRKVIQIWKLLFLFLAIGFLVYLLF